MPRLTVTGMVCLVALCGCRAVFNDHVNCPEPTNGLEGLSTTPLLLAQRDINRTLGFGVTLEPPLPLFISCAYLAETQSFPCAPQGSTAGVFVNTGLKLLTATNSSQAQFDSLTTATILMTLTAAGSITIPFDPTDGTPSSTRSINADERISLTHFHAATPTVNGTETQTNAYSVGGVATISYSTQATVVNLVYPPLPTTASYPIGGTITAIVMTTPVQHPDSSYSTTAVTVYDGSLIAVTTVTRSDGAPSRRCTYDMHIPTAPSVCSTPG